MAVTLHRVEPTTAAPRSMAASVASGATSVRSFVQPDTSSAGPSTAGPQSPEANAAKDIAKKAAFPVGGAVVAAGTGMLAGLALPIVGALGAAGAALGWFVGKKAQHQ